MELIQANVWSRFVLGVGSGEVDLGLLVLWSVIRHLALVAELLKGLAQPRDIAVAEDPPNSRDEAILPTVSLDVLLGKEADDGLPHRQPHRAHRPHLSMARLARAGPQS